MFILIWVPQDSVKGQTLDEVLDEAGRNIASVAIPATKDDIRLSDFNPLSPNQSPDARENAVQQLRRNQAVESSIRNAYLSMQVTLNEADFKAPEAPQP